MRLAAGAARLRHIAVTTWSAKCYMNMRPLYPQQFSETGAVASSNVRKIVIATVLSQLPRFKAAMTHAIQPAYYRNDK